MSVKRFNSSSGVKDLSSLYLKSDDNQVAANDDENKDLEKMPVFHLPLLSLLPETADMDYDLEQVPSNYYVFADKPKSDGSEKNDTFDKDDKLLSFDAFKNNIPSSSSVTQMSFMNKNNEVFVKEEHLVNEGNQMFIKPKSAQEVLCGRINSNLIKTISQNKSKQKVYNGHLVLKDGERPKSSLLVSRSKHFLPSLYGSAGIDSDYENIMKLRSGSKDVRSSSAAFNLASSPPTSATFNAPVDKFKILLGTENRTRQLEVAASNTRWSSLNKTFNSMLGGYTSTKDRMPLLLKTKNMPSKKFEDLYRVLPEIKSITKPIKAKRKEDVYSEETRAKVASYFEPKMYIDDKTKKHMLIFHSYNSKSYHPALIKIHKTTMPLIFKNKTKVIYCDCYNDILAFANDHDFSKKDKTRLKKKMNILFLEHGQKLYTNINGGDAYEVGLDQLQANNKLYKNNEEFDDKVVESDEEADVSGQQNILFLNKQQKRCSTETMERDLEANSLTHMLEKEFTMEIGQKSDAPKKTKKVFVKKTPKVGEEKIQLIQEKPVACEVSVKNIKPVITKLPKATTHKDTRKKDGKPMLRSKSGCWTCRIRKKKCNEEKDVCVNCKRMRVPCDYSTNKPAYMLTNEAKRNKLIEIKRISVSSKHTA